MFDVSFQEILVILLVALLVVGPARLPKLARTIGLWVGRARAMFNTMRGEVEREFQLEELRNTRESLKRELDLKKEIGGLEKDVAELGKDMHSLRRGLSEQVAKSGDVATVAPATPASDSGLPEAQSSNTDRSVEQSAATGSGSDRSA
jgi:sec-independent protein translocase protein TatB